MGGLTVIWRHSLSRMLSYTTSRGSFYPKSVSDLFVGWLVWGDLLWQRHFYPVLPSLSVCNKLKSSGSFCCVWLMVFPPIPQPPASPAVEVQFLTIKPPWEWPTSEWVSRANADVTPSVMLFFQPWPDRLFWSPGEASALYHPQMTSLMERCCFHNCLHHLELSESILHGRDLSGTKAGAALETSVSWSPTYGDSGLISLCLAALPRWITKACKASWKWRSLYQEASETSRFSGKAWDGQLETCTSMSKAREGKHPREKFRKRNHGLGMRPSAGNRALMH